MFKHKKMTLKRDIPKPYWNKDWLIREYVIYEMDADDIAGQCGVTKAAVLRYLEKFNIPIRSRKTYWPPTERFSSCIGLRGAENPNWKGGITENIYGSYQWEETKQKVKERDNNICQKCSNSSIIRVHHIVPSYWDIGVCDPKYCICLCSKCHAWVHSIKNVNLEFLASPLERRIYDPRIYEKSA
jgi:hypothetical protein